jgi:enoyl-CoA hydratase/carnithine racemase
MTGPTGPGTQLVLLDDLGDGVARITLNRPAKRNAMSLAARAALVEALDQCSGRSKVIVLTGAGPAFCAGVDLTEPHSSVVPADASAAERRYTWLAVQDQIWHHPAIVIAAVNGFALGGGVTLINASDLALAADDAQIGMPEIGLGLYPGLAGPSTQLRLPAKRAAWMVLTAERISGRTAADWGLVNRSVPGTELAAEAVALARMIAGHDAVTLEWCKRALHEVPMHISHWMSALEYGESVGTEIRARSQAVTAFGNGQRGPGQGA